MILPLVADTSFLVDVSRGDAGALATLDRILHDGESLLVPTVVVAEFLAGSTAPDQDVAVIESAADILPFTTQAALDAGAFARERLAEGTFPGWSDALIAGFARAHGGLRVITRNARHFPANAVITY